MARQLVELKLVREVVGGLVLGLGSPAGVGGVEEGDVIISIQAKLVTMMGHGEVVNFIKSVTGDTLEMTVERGELVVPNITECFPVQSDVDLEKLTEEERKQYWQEAMKQGLGSRLGAKHFTTVGKMKVKTPKYNCPVGLYSDTTMDEMICGSGGVDPSKLDPSGPAYQKMKNSKKFDPAKSAVLVVMADQDRGNFAVDTAAVREAREEGHDGGRRI